MSFNSLEYEVSGLHSDLSTSECEKLEEKSDNDACAIEFSSKLVGALEIESCEHNELNPESKTSLTELKDVYRRGAHLENVECLESKTLGEWAYARVNMFLRMKSEGEFISKLKTEGFQLENLDLTRNFLPSSEDFSRAKDKIKKYDLNYDFQDVDELYIENYKNISITW
tara:strand:- start:1119 stop:1628 length:510 start_codon:yes stop_codon:yes gene_type:complete